jgi:hypothetical protein
MVERQLPKLHTGVRFPSPAECGIGFPWRAVALAKAAADELKIIGPTAADHCHNHIFASRSYLRLVGSLVFAIVLSGG